MIEFFMYLIMIIRIKRMVKIIFSVKGSDVFWLVNGNVRVVLFRLMMMLLEIVVLNLEIICYK